MKTKYALISAFLAAASYGTAFAQNVPADPDPDENRQDGKPATADSTDDAPRHVFRPWVLLERQWVDDDGRMRSVKVGVIGFLPPQVMLWDRSHLLGKVRALDIADGTSATFLAGDKHYTLRGYTYTSGTGPDGTPLAGLAWRWAAARARSAVRAPARAARRRCSRRAARKRGALALRRGSRALLARSRRR